MNPGPDRAVRRTAIAATLSLVFIVITTAVVMVRRDAREWVRTRLHWAAPGFEIGAPSNLPAGWHDGANYTVLVFATADCDACRRALPFHRDLANAADRAPAVIARVVLTSPGDDPGAYAGVIGLRRDQLAKFDARGTKLRRVPTILILDRRGVVVEMKEGVLPEAEQHALMERIKTLR